MLINSALDSPDNRCGCQVGACVWAVGGSSLQALCVCFSKRPTPAEAWADPCTCCRPRHPAAQCDCCDMDGVEVCPQPGDPQQCQPYMTCTQFTPADRCAGGKCCGLEWSTSSQVGGRASRGLAAWQRQRGVRPLGTHGCRGAASAAVHGP